MKRALAVMLGAFLVIALFAACSSDPYPTIEGTITLQGGVEEVPQDKRTIKFSGVDGVDLYDFEDTDSRTFIGWSLKPNGSSDDVVVLKGEKYYPEKSGDVTLYAVWANRQVTIYFHYNIDDSKRDYTTTVNYTIWATVPNPNPSVAVNGPLKDGEGVVHTFAGWYTEPGAGKGELVTPGTTPLFGEDTHLYGKWKDDVTITWMNGNDIYQTTTQPAYDPVKNKPEFIIDNPNEAKFIRWYAGNDIQNEVTDDTYVYEDTTFYALVGNAVTITYHRPDGSVFTPDGAVVNYMYDNYDIPTPGANEVEGFSGWFTSPDGGELIDNSKIVTGNIDLYARTGIKITIKANKASDPSNSNLTITEGSFYIAEGSDQASQLIYPHINDYKPVVQLYSDEDCTNVVVDETGRITDKSAIVDNTVYSKWVDIKALGGAIFYRNAINASGYTLYNEDFTVNTNLIFTNGQLVDVDAEQPVYYSVAGGYSDDIVSDLDEAAFVIIYDKNDNGIGPISRYINGIRYTENLGDSIIRQCGNTDNGYSMTNLHIDFNYGKSGTIGDYVVTVRESSEIKDWLIFNRTELATIFPGVNSSSTEYVDYIYKFLGFNEDSMEDMRLYLISTNGTTSAVGIYNTFGDKATKGRSWLTPTTEAQVALFRMI